jgi:hypothetical protein
MERGSLRAVVHAKGRVPFQAPQKMISIGKGTKLMTRDQDPAASIMQIERRIPRSIFLF